MGTGEDVPTASSDTRHACGALMESWAHLPIPHTSPSAPPLSPSIPPPLPSPCLSVPSVLPSGILGVRYCCLSYVNCSGRDVGLTPAMGVTAHAAPDAPEQQDSLTCTSLHEDFVFSDFCISDLQLWF